MRIVHPRRLTFVVALLAAAGVAGACASEGTGPEKPGPLALAGTGDSSGGGGGGGENLPPPPPPDTGDTIIPPPPPPPPPTVCEQGNRAVLDGTVLAWGGPGTDSTKADPLKDVTVQLYRFVGDSINGTAHYELVATETTNGAGKFQVKDLQIGIYRLVFTPLASSPYQQTESVTYIGSCGRLALNYFLLRK